MSKHNPENVFELPYNFRYYLRHPIDFVRQCGRNLKNARMRLKLGYCDYDAWDMDEWFLNVIPGVLRIIADKGSAYPGREPFETPEKWRRWLHSIADRLEACDTEHTDDRNEHWRELMDGKDNIPRDIVVHNYNISAQELYLENQQTLKECFAELAEHFYELWD